MARKSNGPEMPVNLDAVKNHLKTSRSRIYRLIAKGLPVQRAEPRKPQFLLSEVDTWLQSNPNVAKARPKVAKKAAVKKAPAKKSKKGTTKRAPKKKGI